MFQAKYAWNSFIINLSRYKDPTKAPEKGVYTHLHFFRGQIFDKYYFFGWSSEYLRTTYKQNELSHSIVSWLNLPEGNLSSEPD